MTSEEFPYLLTEHAHRRVKQRGIELRWLAQVLADPEQEMPDVDDLALWKAWASIPEAGNRVLCVVYNETKNPWRIVTAYFDRLPPIAYEN
jgi:Domain of unknown function (DUF4258)